MIAQPTLFEAHGRFALWGRASPRHRWRLIGTADSGAEAYGLIDGSGIAGGDWMVRDDGADPNDKERRDGCGTDPDGEG